MNTQDKLHILHHLPFSWGNPVLHNIIIFRKCQEIINSLLNGPISNKKNQKDYSDTPVVVHEDT